MYKRKFIRIIALIIVVISLFVTACNTGYVLPIESDVFTISFINVGQGDATLICFDDGKSMLIDCGKQDEEVVSLINKALKSSGRQALDYLVLTHPDLDHIGNAYTLANKINVETVFIPDINNTSIFPEYNKALNKLKENGAQVRYSSKGNYILGDNYFVAFLYPIPSGINGSIYDKINTALAPTDNDINAVSPVIYVEYCGTRFVIVGDAGYSAERQVVDDYISGLFNVFPRKVNLDGVDFLRVGHHGSSDSTSAVLLTTLKPLNAVISVGGANMYGHPDTETLKRLVASNDKIEIYRTDVYGTISVRIDQNGKTKIITLAD